MHNLFISLHDEWFLHKKLTEIYLKCSFKYVVQFILGQQVFHSVVLLLTCLYESAGITVAILTLLLV